MKKFLVFLIVLGIHFSIYSQEIPVPDFAKRPFILSYENDLVDFERLVAVVDFKIKGMGYGGSEIFYTVTPARSQVRFPLSKMPRFVIKLSQIKILPKWCIFQKYLNQTPKEDDF